MTRNVNTAGARRLAAAPISWGVCEVPGWGRQLAPERVLAGGAKLDQLTHEIEQQLEGPVAT